MIPIADSVPIRRVPWVNLALISLSLLVFALELALGPARELFILRWGAIPSDVLAALGGDPRQHSRTLATLATSQFLHGGWLHLGANMLFLWVFGRAIEDRLGHVGYLVTYLLWGAGAALAQIWLTGPSHLPLIGASGAISGVLGAYFVLYPTAWVSLLVPILFFFWVIDVPAVLALAYWFFTQFLSGLGSITTAGTATGGVAWWAHIGGFVLGMMLGTLLSGRQAASGKRKGAAGRLAAARIPSSAFRPGPALLLARAASLAADGVILLLLARAGLHLLGARPGGEAGLLIALVFRWSEPLVEPFVRLLPAVVVAGGMVLELYTLLAMLVYAATASLLVWLLGLGAGRRGYGPA